MSDVTLVFCLVAIVAILMVKFLEEALVGAGSIDWLTLVLPASILAFAVAVRVINLQHSD